MRCPCLPRNPSPDRSAQVRSRKGPVSTDVLQSLQTIEELFDTIADAYAQNAAVISVTYDPDASYPVSVGIDYDLGIADEEFSLQITDVQSFDAT